MTRKITAAFPGRLSFFLKKKLWSKYKVGLWLFRHARISNVLEDQLESTPCHDLYVRLAMCTLIYSTYSTCGFFLVTLQLRKSKEIKESFVRARLEVDDRGMS
jgi:hypothetical protein